MTKEQKQIWLILFIIYIVFTAFIIMSIPTAAGLYLVIVIGLMTAFICPILAAIGTISTAITYIKIKNQKEFIKCIIGNNIIYISITVLMNSILTINAMRTDIIKTTCAVTLIELTDFIISQAIVLAIIWLACLIIKPIKHTDQS